MNAMGLSDSLDSSSDDIIPMQKRKRQRSYSKRSRNIRGAPSSSSSMLFKSNYTYGLCTLVKFIFLTFVIGSLLLSLALLYNLYNRLESLQVNIDGRKLKLHLCFLCANLMILFWSTIDQKQSTRRVAFNSLSLEEIGPELNSTKEQTEHCPWHGC